MFQFSIWSFCANIFLLNRKYNGPAHSSPYDFKKTIWKSNFWQHMQPSVSALVPYLASHFLHWMVEKHPKFQRMGLLKAVHSASTPDGSIYVVCTCGTSLFTRGVKYLVFDSLRHIFSGTAKHSQFFISCQEATCFLLKKSFLCW